VLRGECSFEQKALVAQEAGAAALIVVNNLDSLYRNASSNLLSNPCATDCLISQSNDRSTCEAASECRSSLCTNNPYGSDAPYCCVLDNLFGMNLGNATGIPAVLVGFENSAAVLRAAESNAEVRVFTEPELSLDGSLFIILLLGSGVTALASYRAARTERKHASYLWAAPSPDDIPDILPPQTAAPPPKNHDDQIEQVELSLYAVVIFIVFCTGALIGLFYLAKEFPQQTVIAVQVLFGISAGAAFSHFVAQPFVTYLWAPSTAKKVRVFGYRLGTLNEVVALLISYLIVIWWFVVRHQNYAWFLLDILAASICCMFLVAVRIPNIKLACLMLLLFFIYDIFMVFISPKFFGDSVMVRVATAGEGTAKVEDDNTMCARTQTERMPMLFMVPRFSDPGSFALLGLGDIFIPGLLVTYACRFDYLKAEAKGRRVTSWIKLHAYFLPACIAYFCGLLLTLLANLFGLNFSTEVKGQPALLYLVPFTLLTFTGLAWCRGDLHNLWNYSFDELEKRMLGGDASAHAQDAGHDTERGTTVPYQRADDGDASGEDNSDQSDASESSPSTALVR